MQRPWGRSRCIQRRTRGQVPGVGEQEGGEWERGSGRESVCVATCTRLCGALSWAVVLEMGSLWRVWGWFCFVLFLAECDVS